MFDQAETVLLLGASGYVGRHVARQLAARGFRVRAVVRDAAKAAETGEWGAPSLAGVVDEWVVAGSPDEANEDGSLMRGITHVVSALGVTRQKAEPWRIDYRMNLRYLELAEAGGVTSFLYVGVMNANEGTSAVARSKAAFISALERSTLTPYVVNPSGYFSDLTEILQLASKGVGVGLGGGSVRLQPIHGADLAEFCVARLSGPGGSWNVGGPDVLTYREIVGLAFEALGRKPRYVRIPEWTAASAVWVADRLGPRSSSLARFFLEGMRTDSVGTPVGSHHLSDYFRELAGGAQARKW